MIALLDKVAAKFTNLAAMLGTLGLVAEVVIILIDVVGRYFGSPLRGAQDITQMSMLVLVFGGMALCDRIGGHIAVDVFERSFPDWLNKLGDIVSAALGATIFAGISYSMYFSARMSDMLNQSTNIINLPFYWFKMYVVVVCVIAAFGMILRAIALTMGAQAPKEHLI